MFTALSAVATRPKNMFIIRSGNPNSGAAVTVLGVTWCDLLVVLSGKLFGDGIREGKSGSKTSNREIRVRLPGRVWGQWLP